MKRAVSMFAALLAGGLAASSLLAQTPKKVLFDHTGWEDGGVSAYWIIDTHEPNPSPANPAVETDWNGGISAWAFDLLKKGYTVQTLPASGGRITYGDSTNTQDLKNYSVYVIPECYRMFTAAEKQAIVAFVQGGGGLFMMGNHLGSTRVTSSHPGSTDAYHVFNDLLANEGKSFGFTYVVGHGPGDSNANTTTTAMTPGTGAIEEALVHGTNGLMTAMDFHSFAYINLTGSNPAAKWIVQTQVSGDPATDYFVVATTVGNGRVVAIGDSSPSDDGTTTTSGRSLIDGYHSNSNRVFHLNAVDWLAAGTTSGGANTVTASITTPSGNVTVASGTSQSFVGMATDSNSSATLTYGWSFGDGSTSTAASTSHVFTNTGTAAVTRTVTFTATDNTGVSNSATRTVTVNPASVPTNTVTASITTPSGNVTISSGASQSLVGTATDSSSSATLAYTWNFGDGVSSTAMSTSHVYTNTGSSAITYTATFTATDNTGASGSATRTVTVNPATSGGSSLSETFESGTKASYSTGNVTLATGSWSLNDSLLGNTSSDRKDGSQSVRTRNSGMVTMNFNFATGAKTVTIKHALYGSDSSCKWGLWYSTNSGSSWTQVGSTVTTSSTTLNTATFTVNKTGAIRFQIRKTDGSSNRINFDDFKVTGY